MNIPKIVKEVPLSGSFHAAHIEDGNLTVEQVWYTDNMLIDRTATPFIPGDKKDLYYIVLDNEHPVNEVLKDDVFDTYSSLLDIKNSINRLIKEQIR